MFSSLKKLFGKAPAAAPAVQSDDAPAANQLWVMIKTDDFFQSEIHSQIEDELIALMEGQGLGVSDGSSSGAHQFDANFCEVTDFQKAKDVVDAFLKRNTRRCSL